MDKIDNALEKSINFLLSPMSIDNSETIANGGFYGFQNINEPLRNTDNPFIFYEITGYGINLLLKLNDWYSNEEYLERAKKAGECILKAQVTSNDPNTNGSIYDRYYPHSDKFFENFHVYPNAVCLGGLCEIYLKTQNERFLQAAISIKNWLFQMTAKESDTIIGFHEFYSNNQKSQKIFPYESICIPFILLKFQKELELTQLEINQLLDSIQWGIKSQTADGYFPFFYSLEKKQFNKTAYSHFTIYPLYNLMGFPLAELDKLGSMNCFKSYQRGVDWITKVQENDGGLYTYYFDDEHVWHQQSPAVAQALCSLTRLYEKTNDIKYLNAAKKTSEWLVENQILDKKFGGGFFWVYPNKKYSKLQKKIMYTKEIIKNKISESDQVKDVTVLLDKVPIWPVQFAIEGLYKYKKCISN